MDKSKHFLEFIQIAGVSDNAEGRLLIDCGLGHLGFPSWLPIDQEGLSKAADISGSVSPWT